MMQVYKASKAIIRRKHPNQAEHDEIVRSSILTLFTLAEYALYKMERAKKIDKNLYEIQYNIQGKTYKLVSERKKGPSPILQISNEVLEDITNIILPYLGPNYDWHHTTFTPKFFGYSSLVFELSNGNELTFQATDILPPIQK